MRQLVGCPPPPQFLWCPLWRREGGSILVLNFDPVCPMSQPFPNQLQQHFEHYFSWHSLTILTPPQERKKKMNQTILPINDNISLIFVKLSMMFSKMFWKVNIQNDRCLERVCMRVMHKHARTYKIILFNDGVVLLWTYVNKHF